MEQCHEGFDSGRLSGTIRTQKAEELAFLNSEIDTANGFRTIFICDMYICRINGKLLFVWLA
ncbi:hypothetical protein C484_18712 [Natrialba taiwanensis DSM 12281]|uniref:Uncharacterized protein n=1 Tax=Natrialba taiwanensis DSM 12281 TaxID=1230458 RepID=L9ZIG0_9EURY|nr:hypothetical protein C484_18712 [Natrialba taiwanensis DSM 12281]